MTTTKSFLSPSSGDGRYERGARDTVTFLVDARQLANGALAGQTPQIGSGIQSSGTATTTVASAQITGNGVGTTYFAPSSPLSSAPVTIGCDVAFLGTQMSMTMIHSSDATILIKNCLHFNFGPLGFTLACRENAALTTTLLTGSWQAPAPADGVTTRRYEMTVSGNTVTVIGPNGEKYSHTGPHVALLAGTLPIWEPNMASAGQQAFLVNAWAVQRDTTKRPSPYSPAWRDNGGGFTAGVNGRLVANKNTYAEVSIGLDPTSGSPSIIFGPQDGRIIATLQTALASTGQTSIVTDKYLPTGSTIQLETGPNTETVTASGNSTGTGPFTTPIGATTLTHVAGSPVVATVPAGDIVKIDSNHGTPTLPQSILNGILYFAGQTAFLQQVSAGVIAFGGVGAGKGSPKFPGAATGSLPLAASGTTGQTCAFYDTTKNAIVGSDGSIWRDPAMMGTAIAVKTASYGLQTSDSVIWASGSGVTISLPAPATAGAGRRFWIKNTDASNAITVNASGAVNVDGAATASLAARTKACYITDGTVWESI